MAIAERPSRRQQRVTRRFTEDKLRKPGGNRMPEVRCTVNNCHYWEQNNLCGAVSILVMSDEAVGNIGQHDEEFGEIGHTPARISKETCCYTFKPKSDK